MPTWAEGAGNLPVKVCSCFKVLPVCILLIPTFLVRFVRHFGIHILVFMVASVVCFIVAFQFFGVPFSIFFNRDTKDGLVWIIWRTIYYTFIFGYGGVLTCIGVVFSIVQVLLPFFQDLDDVSRDKLLLEL